MFNSKRYMQSFDITLYIEPMRRYARVLVRGDAEADDLVQGALLKAYERRSSFRIGADPHVWLMAILYNHFIDQIRARSAAKTREQAWAETNPGFVPPRGEHSVRLEQLRRAMLALPIEQREALHLIAVEGMSVAQTAAILDLPAGTVMSRVGRARAALRRFEEGEAIETLSPPLRLVGRQI